MSTPATLQATRQHVNREAGLTPWWFVATGASSFPFTSSLALHRGLARQSDPAQQPWAPRDEVHVAWPRFNRSRAQAPIQKPLSKALIVGGVEHLEP